MSMRDLLRRLVSVDYPKAVAPTSMYNEPHHTIPAGYRIGHGVPAGQSAAGD
jgi:hypothetical protein